MVTPAATTVNTEHKEVMYKTSMCRTFGSTGSCPYGYKCLFAHGDEELRTVMDNENLQVQGASPRQVPNYRTSIYRTLMPANGLTPNTASTRAYSVMSQLPSSRGRSQQRHNSVSNQSLVAQSARRSRAFFPNDGLLPKHNLLSPMGNRASMFTAQKTASPTAMSRRSVVTPSQSLMSITTPSPRKWASTEVTSPSTGAGVMAPTVQLPRGSTSAAAKTPQAIERAKKLYKTELCRSWQEYNMCPYGVKCQFAHGEKELRQVERHRKYKTELCKKFHAEGVCPFGTRCIFIHEEDDRELPNSPSFDPVYAAQMRQRRASSGPRHLSPSIDSIQSPVHRAAGGSPMHQMQLGSPYSKRFSRFGDEHPAVDDFIKRRMTEMSTSDRGSMARLGHLDSGIAGLSLKETTAKVVESAGDATQQPKKVQQEQKQVSGTVATAASA